MRGRRGVLGAVVLAVLLGLALAPTAAPAGSSETQIPVNTVVDNTCTGEPVLVTGVMHMTETTSTSHDYVQTNWQNTRGVGLLAGTPYQANDSQHLVVRDASGATTYFQDEFELVSLGPTPNLLVHIRVGVSVDRNGNPQPIMQGHADCSGPA